MMKNRSIWLTSGELSSLKSISCCTTLKMLHYSKLNFESAVRLCVVSYQGHWGQLDWAFILLALAVDVPSTYLSSVLSWCYIYLKKILLHFLLYILVSWAWWNRPWLGGWLTNHCSYDAVGWVIWPVKPYLKWPTICVELNVKPYYTVLYQDMMLIDTNATVVILML